MSPQVAGLDLSSDTSGSRGDKRSNFGGRGESPGPLPFSLNTGGGYQFQGSVGCLYS